MVLFYNKDDVKICAVALLWHVVFYYINGFNEGERL